jgi:hypothetical protein
VTTAPHINVCEPTVDDYGTVTIGTWCGWLVQVVPMIFNDRLVLTPESLPLVYDYGWCYPKGGAAHLAALVWDPEAEGEPAGFKKRVNAVPRQAGETATGWVPTASPPVPGP